MKITLSMEQTLFACILSSVNNFVTIQHSCSKTSGNENPYSLQKTNFKIFFLKNKPLNLFLVKTFCEKFRRALRTMIKFCLHFSKFKIINRFRENLPKVHATRFNNVEVGTEASDKN